MPIIQAAVKALRQSQKHRTSNRNIKVSVKEAIKDMKRLAAQKKTDEISKLLPKVMGLIDKAAKRHIIHKNNAARKKSAMVHLLATK